MEVYYFNDLQKNVPAHTLDYPICITRVVHELDHFFHLEACLKCSYLFHSSFFLF